MTNSEDNKSSFISTIIRYKIYIGTLIGIILYIISLLLLNIYGKDNIITSILQDLGIAIITTMIIYTMIDRFINTSIMEEIKKHDANIKKDIENRIYKLNADLNFIKKASDIGIIDVFSRSDVGKDKCKEALKIAISNQRSGEIKIECVAGPSCFQPDRDFYQDIINFIKDNTTTTLKVLILDWESTWANLREKLEKGHRPKTDIITSGTNLEYMENDYGKDRVMHKYYDFTPIVYMIILEDMLFIETYPIVEREVIGGVSPMIIIRKKTEAYDIWDKHFDYVWKELSTSKTIPEEVKRSL